MVQLYSLGVPNPETGHLAVHVVASDVVALAAPKTIDLIPTTRYLVSILFQCSHVCVHAKVQVLA